MIDTIAQLKADKKNRRKHNERNIGMIVNSLQQVGAARSIVIDEDDNILAGNGTVEAAQLAGIERMKVVEADGEEIIAVRRRGLTDDQKRRLSLFDNRTAEIAEWNVDQLLEDVNAGLDFDGMFSKGELDELLKDARGDGDADAEPQFDKAEGLRIKWGVETGQLWQLGEHRLICGDCTDRAVVERVMGGEKANLVWTDPPYGVNYGAKLDASNPIAHRVRSIDNDDLPPDKLEEFIRMALTLCAEYSIPGCVIYVACPPGTLLPTLIASFVGSGFDFHWGLVWVKDQLVLGRGDYHFKHENILYGWKPGGAHYFINDRTQTSIFEYPRPKTSEEHPTMKPVALVEHMIRNSSVTYNIVFEPFSGSGTTLIACQNLNRKCRAIEISPAYVAVSLERFFQATSIMPELITDS